MKLAAPFLLLSVSFGFTPGRSRAPLPSPSPSPSPSQSHQLGDGTGLDAPPELHVIWDELRGLNELVLSLKAEEVDRRQTLRRMESRLRDREVEAEQQRRRLDGLEDAVVQQGEGLRSTETRTDAHREVQTELNSELRRKLEQLQVQSRAEASRLNVSESSVDELRNKNTALAAEIPFLHTRLRATEDLVEQLRRKSAVLAARLCSAETLMEELRTQISAAAVPASVPASVPVPASDGSSKSEQLVPETSLTSATEARLFAVETRLKEAEKRVDELRTENTAAGSSSSLSAVRIQLMQLEANLTDQSGSLKQLQVQQNSAQSEIHGLKADRTEQTSELMNLQRKLNWTQSLQNSLNKELLSRLRVWDDHVDAVHTEMSELMRRLGVGEEHVEDLRRRTTVQSDQISLLESRFPEQPSGTTGYETELAAFGLRLDFTEEKVDELRTQNTAHSVLLTEVNSTLKSAGIKITELEDRLSHSETQLGHLTTGSTALSIRLNESDARLQLITETFSDGTKVAFSAGLTDSGSVGPFDEERTLVFSKTFTNVGQAYDTAAGVFTAPVRGVYYFSFTAADYLKGYMGLYLYRNNQPIVFNLNLNDHGGYASTTNAVALQLEESDRVRLSLPASYRLYDDSRNFSIFSGFLLFPL